PDSRSRWLAPSLYPPGVVGQHRRSSLPPNALHKTRSACALLVLYHESGATMDGRTADGLRMPLALSSTGLDVLPCGCQLLSSEPEGILAKDSLQREKTASPFRR